MQTWDDLQEGILLWKQRPCWQCPPVYTQGSTISKLLKKYNLQKAKVRLTDPPQKHWLGEEFWQMTRGIFIPARSFFTPV